MKKIIYIIGGVLCISMSLSIIIIYYNLLIYGFSFMYYIKMILKTWEFYLIILGIFLLIMARKS